MQPGVDEHVHDGDGRGDEQHDYRDIPPRGDDAEKQYRHQIGEHQYHHRVDAYPQAVGGGAGYCQQGTQYEQLGEYHNADSTPLNPLGSLTGIPVPRLNALAL